MCGSGLQSPSLVVKGNLEFPLLRFSPRTGKTWTPESGCFCCNLTVERGVWSQDDPFLATASFEQVKSAVTHPRRRCVRCPTLCVVFFKFTGRRKCRRNCGRRLRVVCGRSSGFASDRPRLAVAFRHVTGVAVLWWCACSRLSVPMVVGGARTQVVCGQAKSNVWFGLKEQGNTRASVADVLSVRHGDPETQLMRLARCLGSSRRTCRMKCALSTPPFGHMLSIELSNTAESNMEVGARIRMCFSGCVSRGSGLLSRSCGCARASVVTH